MKINPDLLLACAAYIAGDVYDTEIALDLLRRDALLAGRMAVLHDGRDSRLITPTDSEADAITQAHVDAIYAHAATKIEPFDDPWAMSRMVARAILRATPGMIVWWCEVLGKESAACEPASEPVSEDVESCPGDSGQTEGTESKKPWTALVKSFLAPKDTT